MKQKTEARTKTQTEIMLQNSIDENKRTNMLHTALLMLAMAALFGLIGFLAFGVWGFCLALLVLVFGLLMVQKASAAMVLRMYKARPIQPQQAPALIQMFEAICEKAELDHIPYLYYVPSRIPNAFAVGTGTNAAVAISDGLLRLLNPREVAGVLAHEVAHIMHHDIRVMGIADSITRTASMFSRFGMIILLFALSGAFSGGAIRMMLLGVVLLGAPTVMILLQLALSRTREFSADQGSAELTGDPLALASALRRLERPKPKGIWRRIMRPGQQRNQPGMLRTHPPTDERVEKLVELAKTIQENQNRLRPPSPRHVPTEIKPRVRRKPRYHIISGLWH